MQNASKATGLERARRAAEQGDWPQAYALLSEVDQKSPLTKSDLPLLANVAYATGHLDVTIGAWERAHAACLQDGDRAGAAAAAVRVAMHLLFDTALMAPVRGWLTRAERLLMGTENTPVHAWLAAIRSYERLLSGDFAAAGQWARRAVDVGAACDPAAAALGRVAEARSLILQGDVTQGLHLLNDAAVATASGELDALSTGVVYCELVCALQALGQYDVAEQWTDAMERWHHGQPVGSLHGRCRVHRAEILRLRGACVEAEREAVLACEELRPYLGRELGWPLTELGAIRLRTGDINGAEDAFVAAHRLGWDPQPGLALVHLARGDALRAGASIRDALDRPGNVPSKERPPHTQLRRAPLLEALVEIAIAGDDLDSARTAAEELTRIAATFQSSGMAAGATLARARVMQAAGDAAQAGREFEEAAHQWSTIRAPYETALARMGLGMSFREQGNHERAGLEFEAARTIFERIGAAAHAGRAAAALTGIRRPEAEVTPVASAADAGSEPHTGVFQDEGDFWSVVFDGRIARVRDSRGMQYLARLLEEPGREFHVLDLVNLERPTETTQADRGGAFARCGDAGELLDDRAKASYRRRLAEIDEDLAEAEAVGDAARFAQAEAERDILVRELSRAVGLGGRARRAGSAAERARSAVTRALRRALAQIRLRHTSLSDHLDRSIRTGIYCGYSPDPRVPIVWKI